MSAADEAAGDIAYCVRWSERIEAARAALMPTGEPACERPHGVGLALAQLDTAAGRLWTAQREAVARLREAQEADVAEAFQPEGKRGAA